MFESAERGTDTVRSVTLLHERYDEAWTLRHNIDPFGRPPRTDATTPQTAFIKEWIRKERLRATRINESTVAEYFVFENEKSAKKLEVFVWPVRCVSVLNRFSIHYAFLLKVVTT